jgi:protein gp37
VSQRFVLPWGAPVFKPERLEEPARVKKPARIFVCSMSDLGAATVVAQHAVGKAMQAAPWHQYIVLTKRPKTLSYDVLPSTTWIGVTAENQARADERIPILLRIPAAVRFVSVEPMLGTVMLADRALARGWCGCGECGTKDGGFQCPTPLRGLDWVIAGPETGPKARACHQGWLEWLAAECKVAGVPFFDKRVGGLRREWPVEDGGGL